MRFEMVIRGRIMVAAVLSMAVAPPAATQGGPRNRVTPTPPGAYANVPLAFVPNAGQTDARVRFQTQAGGASFYFTPKEAVFAFAAEKKGHVLRLGFLGANPKVEIEGASKTAATVNYIRGNDPARWQVGLSTYEEVVYRGLWPGIDLAFRGDAGTLKYEFRLAPGADPGAIRLAYRGADRLSLSREGDLRIDTSLGVLTDSPPVSYQLVHGQRVPVESRFALVKGGYRFALGRYNRRHPLVIDPGLVYSTFLGGNGFDLGFGIAIDTAGNTYVTGFTSSTDFPTTPGAFDSTFGGNRDAFVTKLDAAGAAAVYSTYLGGNAFDEARDIAIDAAGNAYVTGTTTSTDFPTTAGAFDLSYNGGADAFVTRLDPNGSALVYSTYLGGAGLEEGRGLAIDAAGNAYVTGRTQSGNFPTTPGAFDTGFAGALEAYVTKLDAGGATLVYSTLLGGSASEDGTGITVDAAGSAYVTGLTSSTNFPTTPGAFDTTSNGGDDAFVTKLNAAGSAPLYSTYLGGSADEQGRGIAVDGAGIACLTGITLSTDFPTTAGAFDPSANGGTDAFVTRLGPAGAPLLYSTYLGGSGPDQGYGVAVDAAGNAYVSGATESTNFPTTAGAFDQSYNGSVDVFVTKLGPSGAAPLLYSTYLGAFVQEEGRGIAVDHAGNAYVTGETTSPNFPTTPGAFDLEGSLDAFVTKLDLIPAIVPATLMLSPATGTNPVGTSHTVTAAVTDAGGNAVEDVTVRFAVAGSVTASGSCATDASGQCDFTYQGPEFPDADVIAAYADANENATQDPGEPAAEATKTWVLPPSTAGQVNGAGQLRGVTGEKITLGFHAKTTLGGPQGSCHFTRHLPGPDDEVDCVNVSALVITGNVATIFGNALHNGQPTAYQITARDNDAPTPDEVTISTASGFNAGGPLEHGKVDVKN
jgi:hypothetical protein